METSLKHGITFKLTYNSFGYNNAQFSISISSFQIYIYSISHLVYNKQAVCSNQLFVIAKF
jgi:hypothetical protein